MSTAQAQTFGRVLRAAREQAGLRIDDVATRLRLPRIMVLAIEAGAVSSLPKPPYINGHWRAYADFVSVTLPSWDDVRDTVQTTEPVASASTGEMPRSTCPPASAAPRRKAGRPLLVVSLLVVGLAGLAAPLIPETPDAPAVLEREVADAHAIAAPVRPESMVATPSWEAVTAQGGGALAATAPTARVDAPPPQQLPASMAAAPPTLRFVARGDVWVRISSPSRRRVVLSRILKAGDVASVPLEPELVLSIGAPRNISVFLEDRELPLAPFVQRGVISGASLSALTSAN